MMTLWEMSKSSTHFQPSLSSCLLAWGHQSLWLSLIGCLLIHQIIDGQPIETTYFYIHQVGIDDENFPKIVQVSNSIKDFTQVLHMFFYIDQSVNMGLVQLLGGGHVYFITFGVNSALIPTATVALLRDVASDFATLTLTIKWVNELEIMTPSARWHKPKLLAHFKKRFKKTRAKRNSRKRVWKQDWKKWRNQFYKLVSKEGNTTTLIAYNSG